MKNIVLTFLVGSGFLLGLSFYVNNDSSISFQSLESVTTEGSAVFNEIKLLITPVKDIWIMRQSHHGYKMSRNQWDRLAIVVDKTKKPSLANFYQLSPGNLNFNNLNEAQPLKARCFACHSNGPRAILPNLNSHLKLNLFQKAQIAIWNLRIKTYGRVNSIEGVHFEDGAPFKSNVPILSRSLSLKSCTKCHASDGLRNPLNLEQIGTANFLVKNGFMPPFPFSISTEDAQLLKDLVTD